MSFIRNLFFLCFFTLALSYSAFAQTPSYDTLIVGEWKQIGSLSQEEDGIQITIRDAEIEYGPEGLIEGEAIAVVSLPMPQTITFKLKYEGNYKIDGRVLIENITDVSVEIFGDDEGMTELIKELESGLAHETSETIILQLNEDLVEIVDIEDGSRMIFLRR